MAAKSFIENVNIVANATQLATGDVIEDANTAKDAAEASASFAAASAAEAGDYEDKAQAWATNPLNSPVEGTVGENTDKYSSYHWAEKSKAFAGDVLINDQYISLTYTWSSEKINGISMNKSDINHNHDGIYQPAFEENTGFNKNLFVGTNAGVSKDLSRADHTHTNVYEPPITKLAGFNNAYGTTSGTVSEGDHTHDYMAAEEQLGAYNKPWVSDLQNPGAEEVPRGNHFHAAEGTTYDPANTIVATSYNVQGAISQLDSKVSSITLSERSKVVAGLADGATTTIPIVTAGIAVVVDANLVQNYEKNALYNNNGIEISYDALDATDKPGSPGTSLIEGQFHTSLTIDAEADTEYIIAPVLYDGTTWFEPPNFKVIGGATSGSPAGSIPLSFSVFVGNLFDKNAVDRGEGNYYKMGIQVYSTTTNNIVIYGMTMSWAGQAEGSVVSTGASIDHADLTGLGSGNMHAITDIDGLSTSLANKALVTVPVTAGNIAILDAAGGLQDGGVLVTEFNNKMGLVPSPDLDNFITMTSTGDSKNSGMNATTFAPAAGNATQTFEVADSEVGSNHAVSRTQMDVVMNSVVYLTDQDMINNSARPDLDGYVTHVGASNPHGTTHGDIGAAATVHAHAIADVNLLGDALLSKYGTVDSAIQNNIVVFDTDGVVKDSLVAVDSLATNTSVANTVNSDITGITALQITNEVVMLNTDYDALVAGIGVDANTIYNLYEV